MYLKGIPRYFRYCAIACLAVFGLAASEHHGIVKFGSVPVPGATVTAVQGDKKMVAITDDQGAYSFPDLADGVWSIQVEMLCFTTVKKDIGVAPNSPAAEWELKMLSMDEIKPATPAAAPPATAANTSAPPTTAAAATPAPGAASQPAPAANGNAAPAAPPSKGSKNGKNAKNGKNGAAQPANSQNGFQRTDVNASSSDGAAAANQGAPALAGADASQTAADAFVVNGSTSTGIERRAFGNNRRGFGSLFNGGINFTVDNSYLDARQYSLSGQDTAKPVANHITAGAAVGGPLYVPHLFRWQGNFFATYQMQRNRTATTSTSLMPTDAERKGDFSQAPFVIYDPQTGQPFLNNTIPDYRISQQAKALLNLYPAVGNPATSSLWNYQIPLVSPQAMDAFQVRVNKTINIRNFLNGSYAFQSIRSTNPNAFSFTDHNGTLGMNANVSWRHQFNRQTSGVFGVTYSRQSIRNTPFFANRENISGNAGITGNDQDPGNYGPPSLNFSSQITGLSDGIQSFTRNQTTALSATINWTHRPHNITFGGDVRFQQFNVLSQSDPRGTFGFTGAATGHQVNGQLVPGSDFADFLLGIPDTSSIAFGNADKYLRAMFSDAYFTDDWRISPSLTINAGVRWEYGSPITEEYGRLVNLDVTPGFTAAAPVVANQPVGPLTGMRYPGSLVNPDKHAFQPRVSFAWKPIFGASTVVRGGYGVYYNTSVYRSIAMSMMQQAPLSKTLSVQNSASDPLTLANGFNASPNITPNTFAIDPNFRVGYSQNWQLSVQQNVTASMVMTATYLGIKGTRATQEFLPNTYPAGVVSPCPSCPSGFYYMTSNGNSTREAGQLNLRRRFHNGFSSSFQYTYAKAIDDANLGSSTAGATGAAVVAQNWLDLSAERGLSNFDQRHQFQADFQYSTGVGVHGGALLSGWRGAIFKGWTFLSTINYASGTPLTPIYPVPVNRTGVIGTVRADYTGQPAYEAPPGLFLNSAAYAGPPAGQWGSAGRNSIIGPNQFTMTGTMQRTFVEKFDFRLDSQNILNHPTYTAWNTTVGSPLFGTANPPKGMRALQLTLRWRF
ncbi:MAG TPA: carboxypeptidase-like regulatory domain-containing protein [Bryobacteraceae bacterium]|nr:carboxypeptidase-like regulatory domain-containing protein [Bryobacteraceae bacterium]